MIELEIRGFWPPRHADLRALQHEIQGQMTLPVWYRLLVVASRIQDLPRPA